MDKEDKEFFKNLAGILICGIAAAIFYIVIAV